MADRIALKRLTASDLTFFESLFRTLNVGNQKSINLNADVFIQQFYPTLPSLVGSGVSDRILVSLTTLGPAGAPPYVLSRAVTKRDAYKNWRLNGEFIWDPEGQPGRFDILAANDLALMEFSGDPAPQSVSLLLIAQKSTVDSQLYSALAPLIPGARKTMIQISRHELANSLSGVSKSHQAWAFAEDPTFNAALEDAALGGILGTEELTKKVSKTVSAATLAAAKISAERNGREGEALVWSHLKKKKIEGVYTNAVWASKENAVSSYDFVVNDVGGKEGFIEVKSTDGEFSNRIHMSLAELKAAAVAKQYDLWRVFKLNDEGAQLKIATTVSNFAKSVLAGLKPPEGVTIDSVSIDPNSLQWGASIDIVREEEGGDE